MDRPGDPALNAGMTSSPRSPILVLGGTGKTGRRIVSRLLRARRARPHRLALRRRRPSTGRTRATWAPALHGARAAYISYFPDIAVPGAPEAIAELARIAVQRRHAPARAAVRPRRGGGAARRGGAAGLRRRLDDRALQLVQPELQRGLPARVRARGRGRAPGRRRARAVRRRRRHRRRRRRGAHRRRPRRRALRAHRAAAAHVRRRRRRDRAPPAGATSASRGSPSEDYAAELAGHGVPPDVVSLLRYLFTEVLDGRNASLADGVQRALGRPARDFREFARRAAAGGAWSAA